jgi:DNA-directed RNA polymerase specialized sigma24 family protein
MSKWPAPLHLEENQLIAEDIIRKLSKVYTGILPSIYEREDIAQECWMFALQGAPLYDHTRSSFKTFLYLYLVDNLNMLRRSTFDRKISCKRCNGVSDTCKSCRKQRERNADKRRLATAEQLNMIDHSEAFVTHEDMVLDEVVLREFEELLNCRLPPSVRGDFLRLQDGAKLDAGRRKRVRYFLKRIINGGKEQSEVGEGRA